MKKAKWRKVIVAGTVFMSLGMVCPVANLHAEEVDVSYEEVIGASDESISTYADQIEYVFRIHNGRIQKRRWNYTQGEWVDKKWIDVGPA